jgi:glycerophosphoryl diester phosphodiesterase
LKARFAPDWLLSWEYAHRGLHSAGVQENSCAAVHAAIARGLGIECDIQRSADGHPMVFHDWELDRLLGKTGLTQDFSADELEALALQASDQKPVRLATFLETVSQRVPVLLEVKSRPGYDVERTCLAMKNVLDHYHGDYAIMSFDPRVSVWFADRAPDTPRGLVMREDEHGHTQTASQRKEALAAAAAPDFLAYHIAALPSAWVAGLREQGLPILTWTIDTPQRRERALANADALIVEGRGLS